MFEADRKNAGKHAAGNNGAGSNGASGNGSGRRSFDQCMADALDNDRRCRIRPRGAVR